MGYAIGVIIFAPENYQSQPDNGKANQVTGVERFAKDQHANQKLESGRDILKQADHDQRDLFGSGGKLEIAVNEWLEKNTGVEVMKMTQSESAVADEDGDFCGNTTLSLLYNSH